MSMEKTKSKVGENHSWWVMNLSKIWLIETLKLKSNLKPHSRWSNKLLNQGISFYNFKNETLEFKRWFLPIFSFKSWLQKLFGCKNESKNESFKNDWSKRFKDRAVQKVWFLKKSKNIVNAGRERIYKYFERGVIARSCGYVINGHDKIWSGKLLWLSRDH